MNIEDLKVTDCATAPNHAGIENAQRMEANTVRNRTLFGNEQDRKRSRTRTRNQAKKALGKKEQAKREAATAKAKADHLHSRIMRDLERMYGKGFTRAAGNMNRILEEIELFNFKGHHLKVR